jgi:hypothetical protein
MAKFCIECGDEITALYNPWKNCSKCRGAKIKAGQQRYREAVERGEWVKPVYEPIVETGFIYMLRFENNLCKIGRTINLQKRLSGYRVKFKGVNYYHHFKVHDTRYLEDYFRGLFRRERDMNYGIEWYHLYEPDIEWFKSLPDFWKRDEEIFEMREVAFYERRLNSKWWATG